MKEGAVMEIRPSTTQGTIITTDEQNQIPADIQKSGSQDGSASAGNTETTSNTAMAMRQAGTETKASMKTSEIFIQQQLAGQLRNAPQFAAGGATATTAPDPGLEKARKEAQAYIDHGNKMLKEHRYN